MGMSFEEFYGMDANRSLINQIARTGYQVPVSVPNKRRYSESELFSKFGRGLTWKEFEVGVLAFAKTLVDRFHQYKHYMTEVYPRWEFVERIHWADNSIERYEYSPVLDKKRMVREVAPHGDICF